jgi:hypothetical protein
MLELTVRGDIDDRPTDRFRQTAPDDPAPQDASVVMTANSE